jgi:hypothetical protein
MVFGQQVTTQRPGRLIRQSSDHVSGDFKVQNDVGGKAGALAEQTFCSAGSELFGLESPF